MGVLVVAVMVALPLGTLAKGSGTFSFAVSKAGKVTGRMDVRVSRRDGGIFATSAFTPGVAAVKEHKKGKLTVRTYAELGRDGTIGKFKRWEGEQYWFAFVYDKVLKVRYEKTSGVPGSVRDLGAIKAVPLDTEQPHLAWLLADSGQNSVACVGLHPTRTGQAAIQKAGADEEIDVLNGMKARVTRWTVSGDCGEYVVYVDPDGSPRVMVAGEARFDRMP